MWDDVCGCGCVSARPVFLQVLDGPHNVNVTEGDSAIINCSAYAEPEAHVQWFENGEQIDRKSANLRNDWSDDVDVYLLQLLSQCHFRRWSLVYLRKGGITVIIIIVIIIAILTILLRLLLIEHRYIRKINSRRVTRCCTCLLCEIELGNRLSFKTG